MGLKEKILERIGNLKSKENEQIDTIRKSVSRTPEEVQKRKFTSNVESVIQDMYERGIKTEGTNPTQSFLNELYKLSQQKDISQDKIDMYLDIINKIENMPKEEKVKLSKKLEDELEQDESNQER